MGTGPMNPCWLGDEGVRPPIRDMIVPVSGGGDSTRSWNASPGRTGATPSDYLVLGLTCDQPLVPSARYALGDLDEVVLGRGDVRAATRREGRGRRLVVKVPDP